MKKVEFIGIDVSKSSLDVWLFLARQHRVFSNNKMGFIVMLKWIEKVAVTKITKTAFCFEHTGLYSLPLSRYLSEQQVCFYQVSGLLVKRSLGLARGKNDKVDAKNLSHFAYLHQEELVPYQMPSKNIIQLKNFLSFRERLVKQRSGYKAHIRELKHMDLCDDNDLLIKTSLDMIDLLNRKIKLVEKEMDQITTNSEELKITYQNISSINGVGLILSIAMIASTNNFRSFTKWRKFACYAGIAPFEHQSGTSYKGRTRISYLGNRSFKTLLGLAAVTSIQHNPEMRSYYQRRLLEGKNKMSSINVIRNKILSRIFAVAKRQTPYVDICKYAA